MSSDLLVDCAKDLDLSRVHQSGMNKGQNIKKMAKTDGPVFCMDIYTCTVLLPTAISFRVPVPI